MTDFGLYLTYIMIGFAILACIASPILQIKNNPEKIKQMAVPIVALIIIVGLSMLISSGEVIGGSLITFYILSLIAIVSVFYSEFIYKLFNNGKK